MFVYCLPLALKLYLALATELVLPLAAKLALTLVPGPVLPLAAELARQGGNLKNLLKRTERALRIGENMI